jgi:hypothetical protein
VQNFNITVSSSFIPVTNITNVPNSTTTDVELTLTGTVEPDNATYQDIVWTVASQGTTDATIIDSTFFATAPGTAVVLATITNGVEIGIDYTQEFYIEVSTTGIVNTLANQLQLYPNPVKDELIIDKGQLRIDKVEITDLTGKTVINCQLSAVNSINVSALPQGIYLVKIETNEGIVTKKFVKE